MTDQIGRELGFGHLGQAQYDIDQRKWTFSRRAILPFIVTSVPIFHATKEKARYRPGSTNHVSSHDDGNDKDCREISSYRALENHLRKLRERFPEFGPIERLCLPLERISRVIINSLDVYDPLQGELMACMSVDAGSYHQHCLVVSGGVRGDSLRFVSLMRREGDLEEDTPREGPLTRKIEILVENQTESFWQGEGVAINQICVSSQRYAGFGQVEDSNPFVAIRFPTRTIVLRPYIDSLLLKRAGSRRKSKITSPEILPGTPLEIHLDMTGGFGHSHVSWNPWERGQLAITDQSGTVRVFSVESHSTARSAPFQFPRAQLVYEVFGNNRSEEISDRTEVMHDGWANTIWITDRLHLAICTRTQLRIVKLSTGEELSRPRLGLSASTHWILDIRAHPTNRSHLIVLTNICVHWLKVVTSNQETENRYFNDGANLILSARHFRDPSDVTLQLSVIEDHQISSKLNPIITWLSFSMDEDDADLPLLSSTPASMSLPDHAGRGDKKDGLQTIIAFSREARDHSNEVAIGHTAKFSEIVQLFMLDKRLELTTGAIAFELARGHTLTKRKITLESSPREKIESRSAKQENLDDDFIVPDPSAMPLMARYHQRSRHCSIEFTQSRGSKTHPERSKFPMRMYEAVANLMGDVKSDSLESPAGSALEPPEALMMLASSTRTAQTLFECLKDFDQVQQSQVSDGLQELLRKKQNLDESFAGFSRPFSFHSLLRLQRRLPGLTEDGLSIESLYENLIGKFLDPLASAITGRFRLMTNRVLRQATLDVLLAGVYIMRSPDIFSADGAAISTSIPQEDGSLMVNTTADQDSMSDILSSPYFSTRPAGRLLYDGTQGSYPTPSISHGLSRYSSPLSYTSSKSDGPVMDREHVATLSRYTSFSEQPSALRSGAKIILKHWDIGVDPDSYNYTATTRAIDELIDAQELEEKLQGMNERRRKRMIRRIERDSAKRGARDGGSNVQIPSVAIASQPTTSITQSQSASLGFGAGIRNSATGTRLRIQQPTSSQLSAIQVASQQVPGRFGGRPPPKKKVKRSGF